MNHFFTTTRFQTEERARSCLEALARRHHIAGLTLDANGGAGLELAQGERLYFRLDVEANILYLYAPFTPLRGAQDGRVLVDMLRLNCLETSAHGGVISISEQLDAFIYHLGLPVETLELDALEQAIEEFIKQRQHLAQQFQ
ncbi:Putative uncharacterized protein [Mycoavidus cysteinexigens]|uniref:Uncharacterized protein n=1 Tax=Mycoavidus cysteinexigens TaxID=1553431 RepID=A0A2Z6ETL4_9BURK|nr:CesT family type III secretion system chaperone [Mycoavidus cysteinexigens]BBE08741.1 Putative uncharacterized protein [Mycoavidus cysteinexigens]GAM52545.1 hypothetical protein EBME_1008 [bacterium endosymbiont of Mortierella elongata FMR23-6]GLR01563.1 hypothetical protein GCM10007934_13750 [Mycoavidus cysteinexigens]